jgi:hypothetical protein
VLIAGAIVFIGFGLVMCYLTVVPDIGLWSRSRAWVPVQAKILSVELRTHASDDDGETYSIKAKYRYSYQGREYTRARIGIHAGSDNIGSYHKDFYKALKRAHDRGMLVTAWVNPKDPGEAILDREMRWGLFLFRTLAALLFTVVGIGLLYKGLKRPPPPPSELQIPEPYCLVVG